MGRRDACLRSCRHAAHFVSFPFCAAGLMRHSGEPLPVAHLPNGMASPPALADLVPSPRTTELVAPGDSRTFRRAISSPTIAAYAYGEEPTTARLCARGDAIAVDESPRS